MAVSLMSGSLYAQAPAGPASQMRLRIPGNPDNQRPEAVFEFDRIRPGHFDELQQAVSGLGGAIRARDIPSARKHYADVERLYPDDPVLLGQLKSYLLLYEGMQLYFGEGKPAEAIRVFERLDALGPSFTDHLRPWGMASLQLGDSYSAVKHLQAYVDRGGSSRGFAGALGQVYHGRNRDDLAIRFLREQLQYSPGDPGARALLSRIESEQTIKGNYTGRESEHFRVEFDGAVNLAAAYQLLQIMEQAWREVGRLLDHTPRQKISIILFTGGSYRQLAAKGFAPDWSGGFWDGQKIRVPSEKAASIDAATRNTLYHEYVHALIHDRAGTGYSRIPRWLHEGLAQLAEPDNSTWKWNNYRPPAGWIPPSIAMLGTIGWNFLGPEAAAQLYLQSFSLVKYMTTAYPRRNILALIDAFAAGAELDAAFRQVYGIDSVEMHNRWWRTIGGAEGLKGRAN